MQINRLLEIVYILLRQETVTAKEFAARFGVSQRTIYRDIDTLSLAGIPVYTEKGKGGGISLLPGFVLSKSILSEEEQGEILSALHGMSSIRTAETAQVLQKLSAVFNKSAANWLEVDFSNWDNSNGSLFNNLKSAILDRRIVEFDYYSAYGEKSARRVEPMQIWFKHRAWYARGFCLTRQAPRLFKLTRIRNLAVTDEHFGERNLNAAEPNISRPRKQYAEIIMRIAPEMAYRIYDDFDDDMIEQQPDGSFIVNAIWPEDEWVYGFILSFGEYAEVLEPGHIRGIIKAKAQMTTEKYL